MSCGKPHEVPCSEVLAQVYSYLDSEIDDDAASTKIRQHLDECGPCLREYGLEEVVKKLVHKCCGAEPAPSGLRSQLEYWRHSPAKVKVSCAKRDAAEFAVLFVGLDLQADSSPLKRGEHRTLAVRVSGTTEKISLEARNLAPDVAELVGGNPVRRFSSGEEENTAQFEVIGRKNGTFLISIRLVPGLGRPQP